MLRALASRALELNAVHIELDVRTDNPARAIYEAAGFMVVHQAVTYVASRHAMTLLVLRATPG